METKDVNTEEKSFYLATRNRSLNSPPLIDYLGNGE